MKQVTSEQFQMSGFAGFPFYFLQRVFIHIFAMRPVEAQSLQIIVNAQRKVLGI